MKTKNKKTLCFTLAITTAIVTLGATLLVKNNVGSSIIAQDCPHEGYHYDAHDSTCTVAGNKEFWACCKCHNQWLSNPGGNFVDNTLSEQLESTHIAYVAAEHIFNEKLVCTGGCGESFSEANGFSEATSEDLITPVTLSTLGQSAFDFSNSHTFVNFDFAKNGDFELNYSYKYTKTTSGGDYYSIYLFNGRDEKGLVLQVSTNRTEGGADVYLYRNSATQAGAAYKGDQKVKDLPTGRSEDGHYYFPFKSQLTGNTATDDNIMSIRGTVVNKATNEYNVVIKSGYGESNVSQLTTDYNFGQPAHDITLNITLGANYFDSVSNPCFRFSLQNTQAVHASDYVKTYTNKEVVYVNEDGAACGKQTFASDASIKTPKVVKTGYKFIGWCDKSGNDARDITENGKYVLKPQFIQDLGENQVRQTLSEFGFAGKDTTKWTNSWKSGENTSTYGMKNADGNTELIEVAFRYRFQFTTTDQYPIFGFSYDSTDESARVYTRVDLINSSASFKGYIYSNRTSLGNAGAAGTYFADSNCAMVEGMIYMVRIQIVKNQSDFTINVIMQSLGDSASSIVSRNFTYNSSARVDFSDPLYTKFSFNSASFAPFVKDAY